MERTLKHKVKSWKEYNKRNNSNLTLEEYEKLSETYVIDRIGKINPLQQRSYDDMVQHFGQYVLTEIRECRICHEQKRLVEFPFRRKENRIEHVCRFCYQDRKKTYPLSNPSK